MSAQRPVRRAMFAISSRKASCSRGDGVSAWACRRVFAFLVDGSSALGAVALLVFASIAVIAHVSA